MNARARCVTLQEASPRVDTKFVITVHQRNDQAPD
jgi:hypothetical protein